MMADLTRVQIIDYLKFLLGYTSEVPSGIEDFLSLRTRRETFRVCSDLPKKTTAPQYINWLVNLTANQRRRVVCGTPDVVTILPSDLKKLGLGQDTLTPASTRRFNFGKTVDFFVYSPLDVAIALPEFELWANDLHHVKGFAEMCADGNIVCDMGWALIPVEMALNSFSMDDIRENFRVVAFPPEMELDKALVARYLGVKRISRQTEDLIYCGDFDWTPKLVDVAIAKAVTNSHKWVQIVALADGREPQKVVLESELCSIKLADKLRKEMGLGESVKITNDNKKAVQSARVQKIFNVEWKPRGKVKQAHIVTMNDATAIFNRTGNKLDHRQYAQV